MDNIRTRYIQPASMYIIKFCKKHFLNTWVFRLPMTEFIYKKVFYLGREKGEEQIIFRGKKLIVNTKDISIVPALINNDFEEFELNLFEQILRKGMTVLDIGANIGVYSLLASDKIGKGGSLYAFEPVPENFEILKRNLSLNGATNVQAINCAIGDRSGEVQISIVKDSLATHHINVKPVNPITVKIDTIDNFVRRNHLEVDLIKMDIEGYEGHAIDGAKKTLSRKNIILLTEFSADFIKRSGKHPAKSAEVLLKTFKYCYCIDESKDSLAIVNNIADILNRNNKNFIFMNKPHDLK